MAWEGYPTPLSRHQWVKSLFITIYCVMVVGSRTAVAWWGAASRTCLILLAAFLCSCCRTRHVGLCWRSRDELIGDGLLWTPSHGRAKAGWPARTYIQQLCADTGCIPGDLPEAMDYRVGWRDRVREIHADSATWWWWWWLCNGS